MGYDQPTNATFVMVLSRAVRLFGRFAKDEGCSDKGPSRACLTLLSPAAMPRRREAASLRGGAAAQPRFNFEIMGHMTTVREAIARDAAAASCFSFVSGRKLESTAFCIIKRALLSLNCITLWLALRAPWRDATQCVSEATVPILSRARPEIYWFSKGEPKFY